MMEKERKRLKKEEMERRERGAWERMWEESDWERLRCVLGRGEKGCMCMYVLTCAWPSTGVLQVRLQEGTDR